MGDQPDVLKKWWTREMINQMGHPSDYHGEIPETRSERSESGESVVGLAGWIISTHFEA